MEMSGAPQFAEGICKNTELPFISYNSILTLTAHGQSANPCHTPHMGSKHMGSKFRYLLQHVLQAPDGVVSRGWSVTVTLHRISRHCHSSGRLAKCITII